MSVENKDVPFICLAASFGIVGVILGIFEPLPTKAAGCICAWNASYLGVLLALCDRSTGDWELREQSAFLMVLKLSATTSAIIATYLDLFELSAGFLMACLEILSASVGILPDSQIGQNRLPFAYNVLWRIPAAGFAILAALPKLEILPMLEPHRAGIQVLSIILAALVGLAA